LPKLKPPNPPPALANGFAGVVLEPPGAKRVGVEDVEVAAGLGANREDEAC
jgi:hypothetical protein